LSEVDNRVGRSLEQILREIAAYRIAYTYGKSGRIEFSFRDRVGEISKLIKFPYGGNPVAVVYGPKGCGKSELSRFQLTTT
jgi:polynucleotide 5'-kinase involved in rRNA processing